MIIDASKKTSPCSLRIPDVYNTFLEKTVADTQNKKSDLFLVGSAILACIDNDKTWKNTLDDTKKHKAFEHDINTIAQFSHLLVDLNLLEAAGITQETLDHVILFYSKMAQYLKDKQMELDANKET